MDSRESVEVGERGDLEASILRSAAEHDVIS